MHRRDPKQSKQTRPFIRALVVDDSEGMRRSVVALLKTLGIQATLATNGAEAIAGFAVGRFDLLLTDLQMPEMNGLELLEWVRENHPELPAVLMTGALTEPVARAALASGADAVLSKPFSPADFSAVLERLFFNLEVPPACVTG